MEKSILINRAIPLEVVAQEKVFILLELSAFYIYDEENKKTNQIGGINYTVVNTENFEKFSIKVLGKKPLMTREELQKRRENSEKIFVEFENASIKIYWNSFKNCYCDSFKADSVAIVETENI